MRLASLFFICVSLCGFPGLLAVGEPSSTPSEIEAEMAKKPMAWDLGPETVDVSTYPASIQEAYKVFVNKCGKCHTAARALNSPYSTPEEWNSYVNKMMKKPGSGITPKEGKLIFDFLVHDSKARKLSDPEAWNKYIDEILASFQEKYGQKRAENP